MITQEDIKWLDVAKEMASYSQDYTSYKKVGCVIVKNNTIIGRGYRKTVIFHTLPYRDITYHAEHLALIEAKELAEGATLYSTMEPCNHRIVGDFNALQLPPSCSELIVAHKIKRVVYCDPDDQHGGSDFLKLNGIEVQSI